MKTMSKNVNIMFASSIFFMSRIVCTLWHGGTLFTTMYFKNATKTELCQRIAKLRNDGC